MLAVVSPYHLTTREPASLAGLQLASSVATLLPTPLEDGSRAGAERAAAESPAYVRFMESWRWSVPLWSAGVLSACVDRESPWEDVRWAWRRIGVEPGLASLRSLAREDLFESDHAHLEAVSRDVLRAGPDPGITVPVAAGLDAFAARHGGVVMRSSPSSVVQHAEAALGQRVLSIAIPALVSGGARAVLVAREVLGETLGPLREALAGLAEGRAEGRAEAAAEVTVAARAYAVAFAEAREELLAADEDDEERTVEGTVALTGLVLPADAVLTASVAALRTLRGERRGRAATAEAEGALVVGRSVLTLLVRVVGRGGR